LDSIYKLLILFSGESFGMNLIGGNLGMKNRK